MSGGRFNYEQNRITDIADDIAEIIRYNDWSRERLHDEGKDEFGSAGRMWSDWWDPRQYLGYTWKDRNGWRHGYTMDEVREHNSEKALGYPPEVVEKFREAECVLRMAYVYAQRIDWLLSGDDGEDSFLECLKEDLRKIRGKPVFQKPKKSTTHKVTGRKCAKKKK